MGNQLSLLDASTAPHACKIDDLGMGPDAAAALLLYECAPKHTLATYLLTEDITIPSLSSTRGDGGRRRPGRQLGTQ